MLTTRFLANDIARRC